MQTTKRGGRNAIGAIALAMCAAAFVGPAQADGQHDAKIPNLSGYFAQNSSVYLPPEHGSPGPVMTDPDHPHVVLGSGITSPWVGNYKDPLLKPWVAAVVKKHAETELSGGFYRVAYQLCFPLGVPLILTQRGNIQLLQQPNEVTIVYQRDHQVRHVYLNRPHSKNPPATWYGESVGHYEGDTLVVDTIGQNTQSVVDRFGSPHTAALHVVERYHVVDKGKTLQVDFMVEDPGAFTSAWYGMQKYHRTKGPFEEVVCAENNRNVETGKDYPIPMDHTPDF